MRRKTLGNNLGPEFDPISISPCLYRRETEEVGERERKAGREREKRESEIEEGIEQAG